MRFSEINLIVFSLALWLNLPGRDVLAQESVELAIGTPDAVVDLRTQEGVDLLDTQWRYSDAQIIESDFNAPGPKGQDKLKLYPAGKPIKTNDIAPKAGGADFDDSKWEVLSPLSLEERRGTGRLSFNWYRMNVTVPAKIANFDATGSTAVLEIVIDDYAEVWVDGKLSKSFGQSGGSVVKGWNARNRVELGNDLRPGQQIQIAILGINGPMADMPDNYIWIRSAAVDFYKERPKFKHWQDVGEIVRIDPALDEIIDPEAKIERIATGFQFTEGPLWHPNGYLLFSDPNANVIYSYHPNGNVAIFRTKSGYSGFDIGEYHQPGSNGLAFDQEGRLVVCEHGNRRIVRLEHKGPVTVLADSYKGMRFNSPNDLVYRSDGALYITDPPYGLPKFFDDPGKETPHQGIYCLIGDELKLVATDLGGPNGIAFSPDEKYLYASNWDIRDIHNTKVIMRYEAHKDGTLSNGEVFFDMNKTDDEEALDGLKVDVKGNIYSSAPGGVWIISSQGKYLGKIKAPERPANMAWGDSDGKTLYMTAHSGLYKMRVKIAGFRSFEKLYQ